jgi:hypothetical protein
MSYTQKSDEVYFTILRVDDVNEHDNVVSSRSLINGEGFYFTQYNTELHAFCIRMQITTECVSMDFMTEEGDMEHTFLNG